jgi:hypothetical protein
MVMVKVGTGMCTRLRKMWKMYEHFVELLGGSLWCVERKSLTSTQDR